MSANSNVEQCDCGEIRKPGAFAGGRDFESFIALLEVTPYFSPTAVLKPYLNVGEVEHWYQCKKCQSVWRLVEPDAPFAGFWERVSEQGR